MLISDNMDFRDFKMLVGSYLYSIDVLKTFSRFRDLFVFCYYIL